MVTSDLNREESAALESYLADVSAGKVAAYFTGSPDLLHHFHGDTVSSLYARPLALTTALAVAMCCWHLCRGHGFPTRGIVTLLGGILSLGFLLGQPYHSGWILPATAGYWYHLRGAAEARAPTWLWKYVATITPLLFPAASQYVLHAGEHALGVCSHGG
jgi:hypothetical protein